MNFRTRKISLLGDSISTYPGYQPDRYVYYRGERLSDNGLESEKDTWWMQVVEALGGELCVNNSVSGSTVAGAFFPSACSDERCSALGTKEAPDVILIYMGTNDRGLAVPLGTEEPKNPNGFYGAYRFMLQKINKNYPAAKIVCATLPMGCLRGQPMPEFDRVMRKGMRYSDAIAKAAAEEGCILADIAAFGKRYETLDFCHPTREGHKTLAELWLQAIAKEV